MTPIDCKNTISSSYLFVCFFITTITFERMTTTMSQRMSLVLITGKLFNQCASYSPIFSPLHNAINKEQGLYNQSSHYEKHRKFAQQSVYPNYRSVKSGYIITFHLQPCCLVFQAKNSAISDSATVLARQPPSLLVLKSDVCTANRYLHSSKKKKWGKKDNKSKLHDASIAAAVVGEKAHHRMKRYQINLVASDITLV